MVIAATKFYTRLIILLVPVLNIKQRKMPILQLSSLDLTAFSEGVTRDGGGLTDGCRREYFIS